MRSRRFFAVICKFCKNKTAFSMCFSRRIAIFSTNYQKAKKTDDSLQYKNRKRRRRKHCYSTRNHLLLRICRKSRSSLGCHQEQIRKRQRKRFRLDNRKQWRNDLVRNFRSNQSSKTIAFKQKSKTPFLLKRCFFVELLEWIKQTAS